MEQDSDLVIVVSVRLRSSPSLIPNKAWTIRSRGVIQLARQSSRSHQCSMERHVFLTDGETAVAQGQPEDLDL